MQPDKRLDEYHYARREYEDFGKSIKALDKLHDAIAREIVDSWKLKKLLGLLEKVSIGHSLGCEIRYILGDCTCTRGEVIDLIEKLEK